MLGVRSNRLSRGRPDSLAHKQKEKNVLFYPAHSDGYSSSPTSTTSCETSLESSTYMENQPFDCVELSPGAESTLSSQSSKTQESVLKTNKYCGSAFVKARKQRQEMKDASIVVYDDPPLDHLFLLGPSTESESYRFRSKLLKEATLLVRRRHSGEEEVAIPFGGDSSPPLPLQSTLPSPSPWPQSNWKTGSSKANATPTTKLPDGPPSTSVRHSIINSIKAKSVDVTPVINTGTARDDTSETAKTRKDRHIDQVKAMARSRKERHDKAKELQNDPDQPPPKSKYSKGFKDFVDHLLMVNDTNQLCRSPEPTQPLPSEDTASKKNVSWKGDPNPNLAKPVLRRRSNSPTRPNLPKPVLKRAQHFTQRFSSRSISINAPYDEDAVFSSPGGWKSMLMCGSVKVLDSP